MIDKQLFQQELTKLLDSQMKAQAELTKKDEEEIMQAIDTEVYKYKRMSHQDRVKEFMVLAKQETPDKPTVPSDKVLELRAKLMLEELFELLGAMGITVINTNQDTNILDYKNLLISRNDYPVDIVEVADGLADESVVLYGTAVAFGIDMKPLVEEVDNNNLAKFGPGHYIREDGKLMKPPGHKKPDIAKVLKQQG